MPQGQSSGEMARSAVTAPALEAHSGPAACVMRQETQATKAQMARRRRKAAAWRAGFSTGMLGHPPPPPPPGLPPPVSNTCIRICGGAPKRPEADLWERARGGFFDWDALDCAERDELVSVAVTSEPAYAKGSIFDMTADDIVNYVIGEEVQYEVIDDLRLDPVYAKESDDEVIELYEIIDDDMLHVESLPRVVGESAFTGLQDQSDIAVLEATSVPERDPKQYGDKQVQLIRRYQIWYKEVHGDRLVYARERLNFTNGEDEPDARVSGTESEDDGDSTPVEESSFEEVVCDFLEGWFSHNSSLHISRLAQMCQNKEEHIQMQKMLRDDFFCINFEVHPNGDIVLRE